MSATTNAILAATDRPHLRRAQRPENSGMSVQQFNSLVAQISNWAQMAPDDRALYRHRLSMRIVDRL